MYVGCSSVAPRRAPVQNLTVVFFADDAETSCETFADEIVKLDPRLQSRRDKIVQRLELLMPRARADAAA